MEQMGGEEEMQEIEKMWNIMKATIKKGMVKEEVAIKKRRILGYKDWWDRSCSKKKKAMHRTYN